MTLAGIREHDIVKIDKRGRRFLAYVTGKERGSLCIHPMPHEKVSYYSATAREVVGHYRKIA